MNEVSKYSLVFLAFLLIFPNAVNLAHIFSNHLHEVCSNYSDTHIHEKSIECELFKFHQVSYPQVEFLSYTIIAPEVKNSVNNSLYWFLSDYQKLPFPLRGPPSSI